MDSEASAEELPLGDLVLPDSSWHELREEYDFLDPDVIDIAVAEAFQDEEGRPFFPTSQAAADRDALQMSRAEDIAGTRIDAFMTAHSRDDFFAGHMLGDMPDDGGSFLAAAAGSDDDFVPASVLGDVDDRGSPELVMLAPAAAQGAAPPFAPVPVAPVAQVATPAPAVLPAPGVAQLAAPAPVPLVLPEELDDLPVVQGALEPGVLSAEGLATVTARLAAAEWRCTCAFDGNHEPKKSARGEPIQPCVLSIDEPLRRRMAEFFYRLSQTDRITFLRSVMLTTSTPLSASPAMVRVCLLT